jgi:hypothetical protein
MPNVPYQNKQLHKTPNHFLILKSKFLLTALTIFYILKNSHFQVQKIEAENWVVKSLFLLISKLSRIKITFFQSVTNSHSRNQNRILKHSNKFTFKITFFFQSVTNSHSRNRIRATLKKSKQTIIAEQLHKTTEQFLILKSKFLQTNS